MGFDRLIGARTGRSVAVGISAILAAIILPVGLQAQVTPKPVASPKAITRLPRPSVVPEPENGPIAIGLPVARPAPTKSPRPTPTPKAPPRPKPSPTAKVAPKPAATPRPEPKPAPTPTPTPRATQPRVQAPPKPTPAPIAPVAVRSTPAPALPVARQAASVEPTAPRPTPTPVVAIEPSLPSWVIAAIGGGVVLALLLVLIGLLQLRKSPISTADEDGGTQPDRTQPDAAPPLELNRRIGPDAVVPFDDRPPTEAPDVTSPEPLMLRRTVAPETTALGLPITRTTQPTLLRPWIDIRLIPLRAGTDAVNAVVEFELEVHNRGTETAHNVRIIAQLITAGPHQNVQLETIFASPPATPLIDPPAIEPGGHAYIRASGTIALDKITRLELTGRPMFVPILAVRVLYDWAGEETGLTANGFILGVDRGGADKMQPFWLDTPARLHDRIAHRTHEIAVRR